MSEFRAGPLRNDFSHQRAGATSTSFRMEPLRSEDSPPTSRSSVEVTLGEISVHAQPPKALPRTCPWGRAVTPQSPLGSVVIPAHDEAAVIGRCLDALFTGFLEGELDVVVVCNGCSDETAALALSSRYPVRVVELRSASKPAALRSGDAAARTFPRLYLDADVLMHGSAARLVLERLRSGALAARPPIQYEARGASAPVRSYYRARSRVPAVLGSLWGAGVYGFSATGRSRFGAFPDVVADDLWVDRLSRPAAAEQPVHPEVVGHHVRERAEPAPAGRR